MDQQSYLLIYYQIFKMKYAICMLLGATAAQQTYYTGCSDGWGVDSGGDGCDYYLDAINNGYDECGDFDSDDFTASWECCACGGGNSCNDGEGVDGGGDGCDWYAENQGSCGDFDTDEFIAAEQCCSCSGGYDVCYDVEGTDYMGDGCKWYSASVDDAEVDICDGRYDTADFVAVE